MKAKLENLSVKDFIKATDICCKGKNKQANKWENVCFYLIVEATAEQLQEQALQGFLY